MASLSNGAIGLDLTCPEEVKRRSSIFQRAATWKRSQIRPWLPLKLNRKSKMPLRDTQGMGYILLLWQQHV